MSMELFVFSDHRLRSMSDWQRSIDSERLGIALPADASIDTLHGYLPVYRNRKNTGFECTHRNAAKIMTACRGVDFGRLWAECLCFIWAADFDEGLAAYMAAAAYAKAADGIVFDPQDSLIMSPNEALDLARRMEAELPKAKQIVADTVKKLSST